MTFALTRATPDNVDDIAQIISQSSGGVVTQLLDGLIKGLSGETLLATALMQGSAPYNTDNIYLITQNSAPNNPTNASIVGLLFAYPDSEHKISLIMKNFVPTRRVNPVRAILETAVKDSLYINTLWVNEEHQSDGLADALLDHTCAIAEANGITRLSLFCWNDDERKLFFYINKGFSVEQQLSVEQIPLEGHDLGGSILCKQLSGDSSTSTL